MNNSESKWRKYTPARFHYGLSIRHLLGKPSGSEKQRGLLSPLDQIKAYLIHHDLSRRVQVRLDNVTGGFVLEDEDGMVHAKTYDIAVMVIQQTWL